MTPVEFEADARSRSPTTNCDLVLLAASFGESPGRSEGRRPRAAADRSASARHFPAVLSIAEGGNELTAVRALQLGAIDYLPKKLAHAGTARYRRSTRAPSHRRRSTRRRRARQLAAARQRRSRCSSDAASDSTAHEAPGAVPVISFRAT